jgi:hypothetical protein
MDFRGSGLTEVTQAYHKNDNTVFFAIRRVRANFIPA